MRTFLLFTSSDGLRTERDITYDRNGNVTGVDRFKNASYERETLEFTLSGNRVTGWTDNYATDQGSYGYDAAGNLASDSHKGLLFSYNLANLPSKVEGVGYNAGLTYSYGYLSDGTKTCADCGAGSTAQGLRYRGSFVYEILGGELERLQSISWPEGRIVLEYDGNDTEPCLVSYDWLVTDHLGSVRAIAGMRTGSTGVKEVNGYLPFGTRLPGSLQSSGNRHRFGGKEEQRIGSTDLKLLDFGARYYDAFACRWTVLDPMAWKYPAITPYSYCAGDPVNLVDPKGMRILIHDKNSNNYVEYTPGMEYNGDDAFMSTIISLLEGAYNNGGQEVLDILIASTEDYSIINQTYKSDAIPFIVNESGIGGTIFAGNIMSPTYDKSLGVESLSHEMFHALQYKEGQGGASITNEVEAYVYGFIVSTNYQFSLLDTMVDCVLPCSLDNIGNGSPQGTNYSSYCNRMASSANNVPAFFDKAVGSFKKGARANNDGLYNRFPLVLPSYKTNLLLKYYPN